MGGQEQRTVLLSGIVGSTAYGLAHEGSDIDRLGLFVYPTQRLLALSEPKETIVTTKPDVTLHEARKWCRLAVKGNPTVLELVWLPAYETATELGQELIAIRTAFLSRVAIRNSYLGYATQQFHRLKARGDGTFSADTRNRTCKHARHLLRLLAQGTELHMTGQLTVRLSPQAVAVVPAMAREIAQDPSLAADAINEARSVFDEPGVLPDQPDRAAVEAWLLRVRRHYLTGETA
jgi:predicted nucleotidyltransferase